MRSTDLSRLSLLAVLAVFTMAALCGPVLASAAARDDGHGHAAKDANAEVVGHAAKGDEHAGGKGGLGFTGFKRYDLGIWTLVVFGVLILILSIYAWPNIREGLEKREASIRSAHEEAKHDRLQAEAKLQEARRQLDDAGARAAAIVEEAHRAAEALRAQQREDAAKDAAAERERAKREIAAQKDAMVKELYDRAVQLATLMSEKALRRTVSEADHQRFFDESLAELNNPANKA
jgi:F0F1-type ATP synthase membrane subunit b/b'